MSPILTIDEARAVERPAIQPDESYTFYSTAQTTLTDQGKLLYLYTGKPVCVMRAVELDPDEEVEPLWYVEAEDGASFEAYEGELNGFYKDTGQFYGPEGKWGD